MLCQLGELVRQKLLVSCQPVLALSTVDGANRFLAGPGRRKIPVIGFSRIRAKLGVAASAS